MRRALVSALAVAALLVIPLGSADASRGKGGWRPRQRPRVHLASANAGTPQTACPVSGQTVDKRASIDFQGQRVYFCCPRCAAEFRGAPEKYFKRFAHEGVALDNVQTTCPVTGNRLGDMGKPVAATYRGRTVKLCCASCIGELRRHIRKYLSDLPGEQPATRR